jgi:hypothetical protein
MMDTRSMRRIFLIGLIALVGGCASQVTRAPQAGAAAEPVRALASFDVVMSPNAKSQLAENLKFDQETLRAMIKRSLDAANLTAADGDFTMTVTVDEIRVRSTFNAIMWGFMAGTDQLNGTATLTRLDGKPVGSFKITTSYALGGLAGGQDSARLNWLYEEFTKLLTQELVTLRDAKR